MRRRRRSRGLAVDVGLATGRPGPVRGQAWAPAGLRPERRSPWASRPGPRGLQDFYWRKRKG